MTSRISPPPFSLRRKSIARSVAVAASVAAAARCIAKVVKSKVKFPRFKQKAQEFIYRFPM